ncbi:MAG: hypothetical protein WCR19_03500 [Acholeplasmataceae bacterium]
MSILVKHKEQLKLTLKYLLVSLFLILFNYIYSLFAHGVSSNYMSRAYLIPLIGGGLLSLIMLAFNNLTDLAKHLWDMGLTTLVVGSLLHGVFDIYGSESSFVKIFFIVGILLLFISIIVYFNDSKKSKN